jgi:hypothetical protein
VGTVAIRPEAMLRQSKPDPVNAAAARRIKAWTRTRFSLPHETAVFVSEVACGLPGCPPLETVVTFWAAPDRRHAFKVFKTMAEVVEDDLPPAFMKNALVSDGEDIFCC